LNEKMPLACFASDAAFFYLHAKPNANFKLQTLNFKIGLGFE